MVRDWRPPARELSSSWLARRSTIATSIPASASSAASIIPVGPPPATTTACSAIRRLLADRMARQLLVMPADGHRERRGDQRDDNNDQRPHVARQGAHEPERV